MKRSLLFIAAAFSVAIPASAQTTQGAGKVVPPTAISQAPVATESVQIFKYAEEMPKFKGNLNEFLVNNLRYPEAARKANVEGRAYVQFIVMEDGAVHDVQIVKSSGNASLDAEAIRVVNAMNAPDGNTMWQPGKNNGQLVKTYFTQPITFSLDK